MIIPPSNRGTISFRVHIWGALATVLALFSLIVFSGFALFFGFKTHFQLNDYQKLKTVSEVTDKKLETMNDQIDTLKSNIANLLDKEEEIRTLLGGSKRNELPSLKSGLKKKLTKISKRFEEKYALLAIENPSIDSLVEKKLDNVITEYNNLNESYADLHLKTKQYKSRYNYTPSIWPIFGNIKSGFGWRLHPIFSSLHYHKGIDIPSWQGAPIKATADGLVSFTGWWGGYGLAVIVNHGYGYQTIYAHASKIYVRRGDRVKKGEKIAAVGSTGISTGPHVHYEIRRWQTSINPHTYLNLDIFTASAEVW